MGTTRFSLGIWAIVAVTLAAPGFGQDEAAPAPDAPVEATPVAPAPAPEAPAEATPVAPAPAPDAPAAETALPEAGSTAAPADTAATGETAAPATGDPAAAEVLEIVKETHGDWQVRCAPDGTNCFMYQLALDAAKNPVAEFSLLKLPEGSEAAAGVTVVTPLGTLLGTGIVLQVDGGEKRQYPFGWCSQVGCFARFGLNADSIASLRRGKAGKLTLLSVGAPDKPVELALSLTGFTAAHDALTAPTNTEAPPPAE